jgi:predicted transcriptional regulator
MTPLAVGILLHFYTTPAEYPGLHNNPQQEIIKDFIDNGIIVKFGTNDTRYRVTKKGEAFIEMILSTPYPIRTFVNPLTSEIIKETP